MILIELAQHIMDLFYQDYATGDDFFQLEDFKSQTSSYIKKRISDEYNEQRILKRAEVGVTYIELSPAWTITETVTLTKEKNSGVANLSSRIFSFPYDVTSNGVSHVVPECADCDEAIRISSNELWKLRTMPSNSQSFFYGQEDRIILKNVYSFDKVVVTYIPSYDGDNDPIPGHLEYPTILNVIQLMKGAKDGTIVDMTANQNPNKVTQTEIDSKTV